MKPKAQISKPRTRINTRTPAKSFKFQIATWERLEREVAKGSRSWFVDAAVNEKLDREARK